MDDGNYEHWDIDQDEMASQRLSDLRYHPIFNKQKNGKTLPTPPQSFFSSMLGWLGDFNKQSEDIKTDHEIINTNFKSVQDAHKGSCQCLLVFAFRAHKESRLQPDVLLVHKSVPNGANNEPQGNTFLMNYRQTIHSRWS